MRSSREKAQKTQKNGGVKTTEYTEYTEKAKGRNCVPPDSRATFLSFTHFKPQVLFFRVFRVFRGFLPTLHFRLSVVWKLFEVVYEDDELLVINKPAGLVCHPTKTDEYSSLISRARLYLGAESRPQLVNRLDRETSGVTIVAKTQGAARELRKMWERESRFQSSKSKIQTPRSKVMRAVGVPVESDAAGEGPGPTFAKGFAAGWARSVEKEYWAIVHGQVAEERGVIDAPLGKDERSKVAIKDCVRPDGAPAVTEFWKMESKDFSLLRVVPHTGRKHQIRIHLAHIGHPIVGDKLYGGDEDLYLALVEDRLTTEQRERLILPYHALHAQQVRLNWRGREMVFVAEAEEWFKEMLTWGV
jgi:23S rRNA pseudouridine1911/1915/1917 synthase